jgi:hypothetical protein
VIEMIKSDAFAVKKSDPMQAGTDKNYLKY